MTDADAVDLDAIEAQLRHEDGAAHFAYPLVAEVRGLRDQRDQLRVQRDFIDEQRVAASNDFLEELRNAQRQHDQIAAVLRLHRAQVWPDERLYCECCGEFYPCETAAALTPPVPLLPPVGVPIGDTEAK